MAIVLGVILVALVAFLIALESGKRPAGNPSETTLPGDPADATTATMPWEVPGAKQPADYTWEEFLALSPEQQIVFQRAFATDDAFDAWMKRVQTSEPSGEASCPWEAPGAKQPADYTWEEFLALPPEQQIAFQRAFASGEAFDDWMKRVKPAVSGEPTNYPWEQSGAKQPADYTWEEFMALPQELQEAFCEALGSDASFKAWLEREQPTVPEDTDTPESYPWNQPGAKQPADYTWEEFLALPSEQQIAFQRSFGSDTLFEAWMNRVNPTEPEQTEPTAPPAANPWEQSGAKQPKDYTWEEFLALSPEQQIAFQQTFGSNEAFEVWMNRVNPTEPEQTEPTAPLVANPWEQSGAKQPKDYTWEEFLALSPEQQIAFQQTFGSDEAFEAWMNRVNPTEQEKPGTNPWEQPGAKQPEDYTWEEFLALPPEQQIAFQRAFASYDAFEEWQERVMPQEV